MTRESDGEELKRETKKYRRERAETEKPLRGRSRVR
jgi:hypothetical protein